MLPPEWKNRCGRVRPSPSAHGGVNTDRRLVTPHGCPRAAAGLSLRTFIPEVLVLHMKQVKILESKRRGSCNFRKTTVHLKTPERHLAVCSTRLAEPRAEDSGPGSLLLGPERQQEPGRKNQRGSGRGYRPPHDRPARGAPRTPGGRQGAARMRQGPWQLREGHLGV